MDSATTFLAVFAWLMVRDIAKAMLRDGGAYVLSQGHQSIDWLALAAFAVCVAVLGMEAPILAALFAGSQILRGAFDSVLVPLLVRSIAKTFRTRSAHRRRENDQFARVLFDQ